MKIIDSDSNLQIQKNVDRFSAKSILSKLNNRQIEISVPRLYISSSKLPLLNSNKKVSVQTNRTIHKIKENNIKFNPGELG